MTKLKERTLTIIKPDALQRDLLGDIINRFERKGLKIVGLKMMQLEDVLLDEHYGHHKDKHFFVGLKKFMKSSPVVVTVLEGLEAVKTVRFICGPTCGREADAGTIRGDFSMSLQHNIIHASDSVEAAEKEIYRFFNNDELFDYPKVEFDYLYSEEERE
jgi:nucleoside-diphosphate kinase